MKCEKCGAEIPDDALFCCYCNSRTPRLLNAVKQPEVLQPVAIQPTQQAQVPAAQAYPGQDLQPATYPILFGHPIPADAKQASPEQLPSSQQPVSSQQLPASQQQANFQPLPPYQQPPVSQQVPPPQQPPVPPASPNPVPAPKKKRGCLVALIAVAAVIVAIAVVWVISALSGPKNLQELFEQNPDMVAEMEADAVESFAPGTQFIVKDVEISAVENRLTLSYITTLNTDDLNAFEELAASFIGDGAIRLAEFLSEDMDEGIAESIQKMQESTGFSGITYRIEFCYEDGETIAWVTYSEKGRID